MKNLLLMPCLPTLLFIITILLQPENLQAQDRFLNTKTLREEEKSPPAKTEDLAWIPGYWKGEAFGGYAADHGGYGIQQLRIVIEK